MSKLFVNIDHVATLRIKGELSTLIHLLQLRSVNLTVLRV
jgi:hypothetical protein